VKNTKIVQNVYLFHMCFIAFRRAAGFTPRRVPVSYTPGLKPVTSSPRSGIYCNQEGNRGSSAALAMRRCSRPSQVQ